MKIYGVNVKPGQRACLWVMHEKGFTSNKPHVKSAKISGTVVAEIWPHGDVAVYDTFVRMSQDWINNIPEVDFHGANGNVVISAQAASSRYSEARLSKAVEDGMLYNVNKNTVPMILNFSEDQEWPVVFPSIFPRLLINGCQGIGSTIANYWELNNLNEVSDVLINYINTEEIDYDSIYPDFPSGGIIINKSDLKSIYTTGKGKIILRGRAEIKDNIIIISELPYQVYVEPLIDEIKKLIEKDEINGIDDIYNKTDDSGLKIEIECSKDPKKILKALYKLTSLQKLISTNHIALLGKTPKMFNLKEYFDEYIKHNLSCIKNEYNYELNKSNDRCEIVSGLIKALGDIDDIISIVKSSKSSADAVDVLVKDKGFSERQAKGIVDMRLGRLSHLELKELTDENKKLEKDIKDFSAIVSSETKLKNILIKRLKEFTEKYGFKRKTEVIDYVPEEEEVSLEDVEAEKCVVVMTESGFLKRIPGEDIKLSKRGAKGIKTADDIVSAVIRTNTVDTLLIFSSIGKAYRISVSDIPETTVSGKGVSAKLLTSMEMNEYPSTIYSIYKDTDAEYIVFITKSGMVKKTKLSEYLDMKRTKSMPAITLKSGDSVASALLIKDEQLMIATRKGKIIRFNSSIINSVGKTGRGVNGMKVDKDDEVISAVALRDTEDALGVFLNNGKGKRIDLSEISMYKHGAKGMMIHKVNDSKNEISCIQLIADKDLVLLVGDKSSICIEGKDIPILKRLSKGVELIADNNLVKVSKV